MSHSRAASRERGFRCSDGTANRQASNGETLMHITRSLACRPQLPLSVLACWPPAPPRVMPLKGVLTPDCSLCPPSLLPEVSTVAVWVSQILRVPDVSCSGCACGCLCGPPPPACVVPLLSKVNVVQKHSDTQQARHNPSFSAGGSGCSRTLRPPLPRCVC